MSQEQQESRTLDCEAVIARLHQQLAAAQEAQVSPSIQICSLRSTAFTSSDFILHQLTSHAAWIVCKTAACCKMSPQH